MAWLTALTTLIAPVTNVIGQWQQNRAEVAKAKHEAKIERIKSMEGDWKDEFLIVIWSAPLMCGFIPPLQETAFRAFEFMEKLPQWYMGGWVAISLSVFGVSKFIKLKK